MHQKINKNSSKTLVNLQKILVAFGLGVVVLSLVATIFTLFTNNGFMRDAIDLAYYGRFALMTAGGFALGFLFSYFPRRNKHNESAKLLLDSLLTGVIFSVLTFSFWLILDYARMPMREIFGDPEYPWGRILFEGLAVGALVLAVILAFFALIKRAVISASSLWLQWTLIGTFALQQLVMFISISSISSDAEFSAMTLFIGLLALALTPLVVAILAYFALRPLQGKVMRIFTASTIALLYQVITMVLWEFRTNPESQATILFGYIVSILAYSTTLSVILIARHAILKKS